MFLGDMRKEPYPRGILTSNLMPALQQLKTIVFRDNEHGEASVTQASLVRLVEAANSRLRRAGKPVRVVQLVICDTAHHRIKIIFTRTDNAEMESFAASLYNETRRMKALEKEGGSIDDEPGIGAPRRGATKTLRKAPKSKKKIGGARRDYEPQDAQGRHDTSAEDRDQPTTRRYA